MIPKHKDKGNILSEEEFKVFQNATNIQDDQIVNSNDLFIGQNKLEILIKLYSRFLEIKLHESTKNIAEESYLRDLDNGKIETLIKDLTPYLLYLREKTSKYKSSIHTEINIYEEFISFLKNRMIIKNNYFQKTITLIQEYKNYPLNAVKHFIETNGNWTLDIKKQSIYLYESSVIENVIVDWFIKISKLGVFNNTYENYLVFKFFLYKKPYPEKITWETELIHLVKLIQYLCIKWYDVSPDIIDDIKNKPASKKVKTDQKNLIHELIHTYFYLPQNPTILKKDISDSIYNLKKRNKDRLKIIAQISSIFE